jgi:hypothetical protein
VSRRLLVGLALASALVVGACSTGTDIARAIDAARSTDDMDERVAQYAIVQQQMAENLDRTFHYHVRRADAFSNDVRGFAGATFPGGSDQAVAADTT